MGWKYLGQCGHCHTSGWYNSEEEKTVWNHSNHCCLHDIEPLYERGDFLRKWRDLSRQYVKNKGKDCRHEFPEFSVACISLFVDELCCNASDDSMIFDAYGRLMEVLAEEANRKATSLWDEIAA